jgi:nucleoid-associated protein YgaU
MSERAQLFDEGPRACPFVAFEDDRDRRADEPDHRHRCYAEPTPAPRAIAHQTAYCISPNFAACPIFLDWAVRAAADPVAVRPTAATVDPTPAATDAPSGAGSSSASQTPTGRAPAWAAPPPWVEPAGGQLAAFPDEHPDDAGGAADRDIGMGTPAPVTDAHAGYRPEPSGAYPPYRPEPSERETRTSASIDDETAYRYAPGAGSRPGAAGRAVDDEQLRYAADARDPAAVAPPFLAGRVAGPQPDGAPTRRSGPPARPTRPAMASPKAERGAGVPAWEQPPVRRFEAYPTLRTRVGLRKAPPVALAAVGLAAAALFLFFLPGFLSGGLPGTGAGPTATPRPSATATRAPTPTPEPTPVTYEVASGDTLSGIARRFGLTIEQLQCANGITNPDRLQVGQVLTIPDDDFVCPGGEGSAAPTVEP